MTRRVKLTFGSTKRVWKTVKCRGKIREKSGNFKVEDKWQPRKPFLADSSLGRKLEIVDSFGGSQIYSTAKETRKFVTLKLIKNRIYPTAKETRKLLTFKLIEGKIC